MIDKQDRPILLLDFDGTVHRYSWGWRNGDIYDPIVPGFFEWAQKAKNYFRLVIYSSRTKDGTAHMETWLRNQWYAWVSEGFVVEGTIMPTDFEFAYEKPPAFLTIDDRAIQFRGSWDSAELSPERLRAFKPWNQGAEQCTAAEVRPVTWTQGVELNPGDDTITLFDMRYSLGLFRTMAFGPIGSKFEIMSRDDGTVTLRTLPQQELKEARDILSRTVVPPAEDGT
jgi:hypothetical protein